VPRVRDTERLSLEEIAPCFWRATAHYGFMERPDIPALLHAAHGRGCGNPPARPKLDPFTGIIDAILAADEGRPRKQLQMT
jgi:K+ transporter